MKVDLYIAVTLLFPKGDRCTQVWVYLKNCWQTNIYNRPVVIYMLVLLESKWANSHIPFATKCLLVIRLIFAHFAFFLFFHGPQKNTSKFSVTYDFLEIGKNKSWPQKEKPVFHDRRSKFLENTMKIQITGFFFFSDFSDHEVTRLNFWFLVSLHWWFFSLFFQKWLNWKIKCHSEELKSTTRSVVNP